MADMQQLADDVKALEEMLSVCTRCGMCQSACPLFQQTRKEADVSRGKIALIEGLIRNIFDDAKGVDQRLKHCLLCGSCANHCPSGVNSLKIFIKTRGILARYLGLPFFKKVVFRQILANPGFFNTLVKVAAPFQKLFFKSEKNAQGTSCARVISPWLKNRHMVPLKGRSFMSASGALNDPDVLDLDFRKNRQGPTIGFFVGCLIDKAFPDVGQAVIDCLEACGARILIPKDQGCCGIPALSSGDTRTFDTLVRLNVELFEALECDTIVTACATCTSTIFKLWPQLVDVTDPEFEARVKAVASKTKDISFVLDGLISDGRLEGLPPGRADREAVTYHDPCHLRKSLGVFKEPRNIIQSAGHPLKEMVKSDACCGMGGSFNLEHYKTSTQIGLQKAQAIIDTGSPVVATSCPACMVQISDMLAHLRSDVSVRHPVQLLADVIRHQ